MIDPCHYPKLIGDRLRALRESRGMTHTHVSRVMGIARSTVCRLENGHHTTRLDSIARFARACGYDLRDVLSCVTDVQDPGSIVGVESSCSDVPGSAPVPPVAPTGEVALPPMCPCCGCRGRHSSVCSTLEVDPPARKPSTVTFYEGGYGNRTVKCHDCDGTGRVYEGGYGLRRCASCS